MKLDEVLVHIEAPAGAGEMYGQTITNNDSEFRGKPLK
jgi:hypothetical protein